MNHTPKFQLKLNEESEIDFKLSIEGSVSDADMAKPIFRFVMTENNSDRGWIFPVKTKYKGSDIFTVKIPPLNESAKENTPYSGRLEVIMGNLIMVPTEVLLEFKRPFSVKAEIKSETAPTQESTELKTKTTPKTKVVAPPPKQETTDTLEEDIDAVISIAKPERPRVPLAPTPKPTAPIAAATPKPQNPMLFNNVMFLEEQAQPEQPKQTKNVPPPDERDAIKNKLKNMFKSALK